LTLSNDVRGRIRRQARSGTLRAVMALPAVRFALRLLGLASASDARTAVRRDEREPAADAR